MAWGDAGNRKKRPADTDHIPIDDGSGKNMLIEDGRRTFGSFAVETMSDLLSEDINRFKSFDRVPLLGFYSAGDGGGSEIYWDPNEPKSNHNGGSIIDPDHTAAPGDVAGGWYSSENTGNGCFIRVDKNDINLLTWGLSTSDAQNDVRINAADSYYDNKVFIVPKGTYQLSDVVIIEGSHRITGYGKESHLQQTLGSRDVILLDSPNVEVDNIRVSGAHGDPPAQYQGTESGGIRAVNLDVNDPPHENIRIHDCFVDDCDTGIFISANGFDTDDDGNYEQVFGVQYAWVYNNRIEDIDRNGIEVFISDWVWVYNNYIKQNDTDFRDTERGIRIVASWYVKCYNNEVYCGANKYLGIEAAPGGADPVIRHAKNVQIIDNSIWVGDNVNPGVGAGIMIRGVKGDLTISNNSIRSNPGTYFEQGIRFNTKGDAELSTKKTVENATLSDNKAINCQEFFRADGKSDYITISNNLWISSANSKDSGAAIEIDKNSLSAEASILTVISDNTFVTDPALSLQTIRITSTVAGETYHVYNNRAVEGSDFFGTNGNATFQLGTVGTDNIILPDSTWEDPQN